MGQNKVVGMKETWRVWTGESKAVHLGSDDEARTWLLCVGRDCEIVNSFGRHDMACACVEITWNRPLDTGEAFHKTVYSQSITVLRRGILRKVMGLMSPSKREPIWKDWYKLEPEFSAWLPRQYEADLNNPNVLVLRGSTPLHEQIDARWPSHTDLSMRESAIV